MASDTNFTLFSVLQKTHLCMVDLVIFEYWLVERLLGGYCNSLPTRQTKTHCQLRHFFSSFHYTMRKTNTVSSSTSSSTFAFNNDTSSLSSFSFIPSHRRHHVALSLAIHRSLLFSTLPVSDWWIDFFSRHCFVRICLVRFRCEISLL